MSRVSNPTKEAWILHALKKRRAEFLDSHSINAFVGTWNVNGRAPASSDSLAQWLGFIPADTGQTALTSLPELLVLGFQELDIRAEAFVYNNAVKDVEWTDAIEGCMGSTQHAYRKLASKQLIGMFIMVYARIDVAELVSDVQSTSIGCGIMGMVGNKGAVAVRMVYQDTPLCFVCSHLAHDAAQVDRRNAQFHDLCKRLQFAAKDGAPAADPLVPLAHNRPPPLVTVFDHSYLLWIGDLNYRLAIDTGDMADIMARGEHQSLLGLDQLRIAMLNKQAFVGFEEADIAFAPTYKFILGTSTYDEGRRPAWCDRVLWWTRPGCEGGVRSLTYDSVGDIVTSDHKPVRSRLELDVWKVNAESRQAVYLEVLRELDRYENECIPTATLDVTTVDFGDVRFGQLVRKSLSLVNSGQVPLEYSFVATPSRPHYAPAWLRITPDAGMLLPGEAVDLSFSVLVDERTSAALSTLAEDLSDILVLHLNRGRDYFVQVQGHYLTSVYGSSLDVLVHCKTAVRTMTRDDFEQCLDSGQFSVPKCVWCLTDFLLRYALDRGYSLFYWPGDRVLAQHIRECLDRDLALDPDDILQRQGSAEDHVARTVVEEPIQLEIRQAAATRQTGSSRMSLTDQTLVPSTLHSMFSNMDMTNAHPSTAEALERLSLDPWGVHTPYSHNRLSQVAQDAPVTAASEDLPNSLPEYSSSSSLPATESDFDEGLTADGHTERLEETLPLPETIATVPISAPHDTGVDTVANCLVSFFASLPEPLVPVELYEGCIEAGGVSRAAALEALEVLPPGNLNVLVYLLAFLREAVERGATTTQRVAQVFAEALLRPPPGRIPSESDSRQLCLFVAYLL
ncbi:hypothetical protein GGI20_000260 [Coemansia sp. BCRC 34301]|nr:hypothetical protein GGI20_000260 [Coemansia sp. BCRC 34301]